MRGEGAVPTTDLRRHQRAPYTGPIDISWDDGRGNAKWAQGKFLEVSAAGLQVEVREAIPVHTNLMLRAERIQLVGSSRVKHVQRRGAKYILGLELSAPLRGQVLANLGPPPS
jgi:hypothetical protein